MSLSPTPVDAASLQATLFDFAIGELVHRHRESFAPLWTLESWAKLMIWLALNCGCSGEREALEQFAVALGPRLTGRLRRLFFERELEDLELKLLADPAEAQVLGLPLMGAVAPGIERVAVALQRVGLLERVTGREQWQELEGLVAVPWGERCA